jgi:phosphate transport system protein
MFMILVARAIERIADNTIDIAEQTAFVVASLFCEFTDASQPA